tara:strand:+ start:863 stop:982 length:120 start_codon:yes stop_codon:yes gene_type:complete
MKKREIYSNLTNEESVLKELNVLDVGADQKNDDDTIEDP